ncbi:MAG: pirin family protein [Bacteroidales bacterium]|nr:pirin family protein [Bacteroidales bacterium]
MLTVRHSHARGKTRTGWLDSRHAFSFGDYLDPNHHHFRSLRVINDDRIAPGGGFGMHPHRDMEILTYVLSGSLQHRDSMGHGSIITAGQWQKMSAGTGLYHSEFNAAKNEPVHLLQIWIIPNQRGLQPSYQEAEFTQMETRDRWRVVASGDARQGSILIHQDVILSVAKLSPGRHLHYDFAATRAGWLQVATGAIQYEEGTLREGDALLIEDEPRLEFTAIRESEVLLFDLGA